MRAVCHLVFVVIGGALPAAPATAQDFDRDGRADSVDNCAGVVNPGQEDRGGLGSFAANGIGDLCECGDVNGNGAAHLNDGTLIRRRFAGLGPGLARPELCNVAGDPDARDADGDGLRDDCTLADLVVLRRALLGKPPGRGTACGNVVPADQVAPVVELIAPSQVTAGGLFGVRALASDEVGVVQLVLRADGVALQTVAGGELAAEVTAPFLPGATLELRAEAFDAAGNRGDASAALAVVAVLDRTPPTISLVAPASGAPGSSVELTVLAEDDRGVREVRFLLGGELVATSFSPPYQAALVIPADAAPGALLELAVEALDAEGNVARAESQLRVVAAADVSPPTNVAVLPPARAPPGQTIRVTATAADDVGILRIEFLVDGVQIAADAEPPYETTFEIPGDTAPGTSLRWSARAVDFSRNAATSPEVATLVTAPGRALVVGEVYDDTRSQPLAGASVRAEGSALVVLTDARGRFALELPEGPTRLLVARAGFTEAQRRLDVPAAGIASPLDARLTPRGSSAPATPDAPIRASSTDRSVEVELPAGALTSAIELRVTSLSEQGLPAPLPPGWAPVAAAEVAPADATLALPGELRFPGAAQGISAIAVRFDAVSGSWLAVAASAGGVEMRALGAYALVLPDEYGPGALPAPGGSLAAATPRSIPTGAQAAILPSPDVIFLAADARSDVEVVLDAGSALPSGTPLAVRFAESYDRIDGSVVATEPATQDFLLLRRAAGLRAAFRVTPSDQVDVARLREGVIALDALATDAATRAALDASGGSVATNDGLAVDVPAGALAASTSVSLARTLSSDLPSDARLRFLGGAALDLGGARPAAPLVLRFTPGAPPAPTETVLVVRRVRARDATRLEWVAIAELEGAELVARVGPTGLPLPGIDAEGAYSFVAVAAPVAFVTGTLASEGGGVPRSALAETSSLPFVSLAEATDARYALVATLGPATVAGTDLDSGASASASVQPAVPGGITTLDLSLRAFRPSVVSIAPADGAAGVAPGAQLTVRFDAAMERASVENGAALAVPSGPVVADAALSADGLTLTLRAAAPLRSETLHTLRLAATARDRFGNTLLGNRPDGSFDASFTTADTTPPPRPAAGQIVYEPVAEGAVRVTGNAGAAEPGVIVSLVNRTTGATTSVLAAVDGSFAIQAAAGFLDSVELRLRDGAGNETVEELGRVAPPPGVAVASAAGGVVLGEEGLAATIPPAVLPGDTVVRIQPLDPASFPPLPFPAEDGVRQIDAARFDMADVVIPDVDFLRLDVEGLPELSIQDTVPLYEIATPLDLPANLPAGSTLTFVVQGRDRTGNEERLEVELPIVASSADLTPRRVASATSPVLSLVLPTQAVPGQTITVVARAEPPDLKLRFPAPPDATSDAQFFVWELREVGSRRIYSLVDEAELRTLPDGSRVVETRSPPYRGIRRTLDGVLTMAPVARVALVQVLAMSFTPRLGSLLVEPLIEATVNETVGALVEPEALERIQGIATYEFNVIPVRAGAPAQINLVDPRTNTVLAQAQVGALAPRAFSEVVVLGEDGNAPLVTGISSFKNDSVPPNASISISFSHPMDVATFTSRTVLMECLAAGVSSAVPLLFVHESVPLTTSGGLAQGATILKVTPKRNLPTGASCLLRITQGARRIGGLALAETLIFPFQTAGYGSVISSVKLLGATAFDVHENLMLVAANPGAIGEQNALYRVLVKDPVNPVKSGELLFDVAREGVVRDIAIVPDFPVADGTRQTFGALTIGGQDVWSSVRLYRADADVPELTRRSVTLVGTSISVVEELERVTMVPDPYSGVFSVPATSPLPGVPEVATAPGAIDYEGGTTLYFANRGIGMMTLDVARAVARSAGDPRGVELGPTFLPEDRTGFTVVRTDPDFTQDNGAIRFLTPNRDPLEVGDGPFLVAGVIDEPSVRRVVVNTVPAEIFPPGPSGTRTFEVSIRPRAGITELVATAFDENDQPVRAPLQARLVSLDPPNPLFGPGTVVIQGNPGYLVSSESSIAVTVSVQDTQRFDALFVNGIAAGAKVCTTQNRATSSCGWSGVATVNVPTPGAVTAIVATAIDVDVEDLRAPSYDDVDLTEGLLSAVGGGHLELFDASGLVRIAKLDLERTLRVRNASGVYVDLDGDERIGALENDDGDPTTSWDELRNLALVGKGGGQQLAIVDVTEPLAAAVIAEIPIPRPVYRAWPVPEEGVAYVATGSHITVVDLTRKGYIGLLDSDRDGRDDRILAEIPIEFGQVQDVIADRERGLVYALQEGLGVAILGESCDTDVAADVTRRPVPVQRVFNSIGALRDDLAFGIDRGFRSLECQGFVPNQNVAVLAQGSSACIWREDELCPAAFQRSISDYDFELIYRTGTRAGAQSCADALERSIRNEDESGAPLAAPLPRGSVFRGVSVFPVDEAELTDAFRSVAPGPNPDLQCGSLDDPSGDGCLGRNGLLLKWYLEGEFVEGEFGGQSQMLFNGIDLEGLLGRLAEPITTDEPNGHLRPNSAHVEPSHIPVHEGAQWACFQQYQLDLSGARYRVREAGLGAAEVQWPFWTSELHKVGTAGIRAVYGRLLANPIANRRLVTVSRRDYDSPFGCYTGFDFTNLQSGPDETLNNVDDFSWKRCESFEEYVASQALLSVRDGLGVLSPADAIRAFEMFRIKSDVGPPLTNELAANQFVVKALDLIYRIRTDAEVVSQHETRNEYVDAAERTSFFNSCQVSIAGPPQDFRVPLRVANQGYAPVFGLELRAYRDGREVLPEPLQVSVGAGEDRFLSKSLFSFPYRIRAFSELLFIADPENRIAEYDKENNVDGLTYYYLNPVLPLSDAAALAAAADPPPGAGSRPAVPTTPQPPGGLPTQAKLEFPASARCRNASGKKVASPAADLTVTVSRPQVESPIPPGDDIYSARAGEQLVLHFTVRNLGNVVLQNAYIRTSLPAESPCATKALDQEVPVGGTVTVTCTVQMPDFPSLVLATLTANDANTNLIAVTSATLELQPIVASVPVLEPVIFIPGMAGSTLFVDGNDRWPGGSSKQKRADLEYQPGPERRVTARDALREVAAFGFDPEQIYSPILDELRLPKLVRRIPGPGLVRPYEEYRHQDPAARSLTGCITSGATKPTLFVFPWDWRRSLTETTGQLESYVACIRKIHGYDTPIHLLAHSMGGLVGRHYLLSDPGAITHFISVGSPYLGAPKTLYSMTTGDLLEGFLGALKQRYSLISLKHLMELTRHFKGVHEILPTLAYFNFVGPLAPDLGKTPLLVGRLYPPLPTSPADHARFTTAFDEVLFADSKPVAQNVTTLTRAMTDWSQDTTRARYHHAYASEQKTTLQVTIRGDVIPGLLTWVGRRAAVLALDLAIDAAVPGLSELASYVVEEFAEGVLIPSRRVTTSGSEYGDGTVPAHSSMRIRPTGSSTVPRNLNAPGAELKRVTPGTTDLPGELGHNEMLGNRELLEYIFSILQPDVVRVPPEARSYICPARAPTPGCLPERIQ